MVVIKLIGGLGNQLFQYATAKALALQNNTTLYIDRSAFNNYDLHAYGLHHFNIKPKIYKEAPSKFVRKILNKLNINTYYQEESFSYNEAVLELKTKNIFLSGYFQSELYFQNYRKELLKDLEVTALLKEQTKKQLQNIEQTNSVSIHIRRGDYLLHEKHNTSKELYYKSAMKLIEDKIENPVYYMFSDDMEWVKTNFKTNKKTVYIDFNDAATNYEDLKLMSNCKHNIIANSSFSWWGAWLNINKDKIVIAPQQWFNSKEQDYSNVIPNSWIKI
ncbi:alpha-1,2-fucosyltransferase [Pontimicrobium sp. MEBiC01747]